MLECIEHAVKHGHLRFKWQSVKNCSLLWGQLYFYMTQTLTQKIQSLIWTVLLVGVVLFSLESCSSSQLFQSSSLRKARLVTMAVCETVFGYKCIIGHLQEKLHFPNSELLTMSGNSILPYPQPTLLQSCTFWGFGFYGYLLC